MEPGEEIVASLESAMRLAGLQQGAVTSLIGALDVGKINTMDGSGRDVPQTFIGPYDLSGNGEIIDGAAHLHVVLSGYHSRMDERVRAGHLVAGVVAQQFFVRAYILPTAP